MKAGDIVYVMKYALSKGIFEAEVKDADGKFVSVYRADGMNGSETFWYRDVEVSKGGAEAAFAAMVRARVSSLEKSIAKAKKVQPKFLRWQKRGQS